LVEQRREPPVEESNGEGRPVLPLSKPWRIALAMGSVGLAVLRVLRPDLKNIDALGLGLLVAAVLLVFADIERIEWAGITAWLKKRRLVRAAREAPTIEVPTEPIQLPPAPEVAATEAVSMGYGGLVHRKPFDLNPPTDMADRVLWATEKIRIELIVLAGSSGHLPHHARWEEYDGEVLARRLGTVGLLPPALVEITSVAFDARRELLRGELRGSALGAADTLALDLLQKLRDVKHQYVRVRDPDVMLYRDQSLSALFQETGGVMLVTLDERGRVLHPHVFPRVFQYTKGRFTSWEWDQARSFKEPAWYQDSATGAAKLAWSQAATFTGREYPEQWGVEFNLPRPDAGLV
jgi:hypothetical protein